MTQLHTFLESEVERSERVRERRLERKRARVGEEGVRLRLRVSERKGENECKRAASNKCFVARGMG